MKQPLQVYGGSRVCNYTLSRWVTAPVTEPQLLHPIPAGSLTLHSPGKIVYFHFRIPSCTHMSSVTAVSWRTSVRGNRIRRGDKGFISNTTLTLRFRNQLAEVRKLPSLLHLSTHFQVLSTAFLEPIPLPLTSLSAAASGDLLLSCRHF